MLTATQWLVLDNLRHGWDYRVNLAWDQADAAYRWCVENEYVRDGRLTDAGLGALLACHNPGGRDG